MNLTMWLPVVVIIFNYIVFYVLSIIYAICGQSDKNDGRRCHNPVMGIIC